MRNMEMFSFKYFCIWKSQESVFRCSGIEIVSDMLSGEHLNDGILVWPI